MVWLMIEPIPRKPLRVNIGESRVSENTLLVIIVEMPCVNCLAIFDCILLALWLDQCVALQRRRSAFGKLFLPYPVDPQRPVTVITRDCCMS